MNTLLAAFGLVIAVAGLVIAAFTGLLTACGVLLQYQNNNLQKNDKRN